MNIEIAKDAGFCFGVKRALDKIKNIKGNSTYVYGKLIHNPQVIRNLEKKGIITISETKELPKKCTIVITAHGVSDNRIDDFLNHGFQVKDLTCPLVKNVHEITKKAEKDGYRIIIFGDKEHIEVKGIAGNLHDPIIISNPDELKDIEEDRKYLLVSQTTQNVQIFNNLAGRLKNRFSNVEVVDTICLPTKARQKSAAELAKNSDIMIVIGGKISANTQKLAKRCSEITETHHIETEEELKKEWFKDKMNVGITAGASTPDDIIEDVYDWIKNEFSE